MGGAYKFKKDKDMTPEQVAKYEKEARDYLEKKLSVTLGNYLERGKILKEAGLGMKDVGIVNKFKSGIVQTMILAVQNNLSIVID